MKTILIGAIAIYRSVIQNPQSIIETIETSHNSLWGNSLVYGHNEGSDFRTSSEISNLPTDVHDKLDVDFKKTVSDYVCRFNAPRRVSAVGFLNDDYRGGQLSFDLMNFIYEPVAGDIVIFPSNFPYMHGSRPVIEGIKYSVVSWWK